MGNQNPAKPSKRDESKGTELIYMPSSTSECIEENYIETSQCCWFQFNSMKKRKIIWEKNMVNHCLQVKDQFKWAVPLAELVKNNVRPKGAFFDQINQLKHEILTVDPQNDRDILIAPSQVDQFKNNLKRSVLLSSSQANKYYYHQSPHKIPSTMGTIPYRPSKIQFQRFENGASWRKSLNNTNHKKIQRSPSINSKSGLRKSIMSFVDDTLSSVVGAQREISKQMANYLSVFLKFSMIIEKHFNNPDCMFYLIKRKFIEYIAQTYYDPSTTAQKMPQFIDSINQFMIILKEAVFDYYNLNTFGQGQPTHNPFIFNEENILSLCRTIFFKEKIFYNTVFDATLKFNEKREQQFSDILKLLESSPPQKFYIKEKFCLNERTIENATKISVSSSMQSKEQQISVLEQSEPYDQCKLILHELQRSMTPVSKMKIIHSCSQMMNKQIEAFYDNNGLERQKWVLDADQVLSIFCYVIVSAKIKHLHSHLFIVDNFSTSSQMISIFGYYLSVMNCAIEQLEGEYLDKVNLQSH